MMLIILHLGVLTRAKMTRMTKERTNTEGTKITKTRERSYVTLLRKNTSSQDQMMKMKVRKLCMLL